MEAKHFELAVYLEPLTGRPDLKTKRMFGCLMAYLGPRLVVVLAESKDKDWDGIMFPVEKEFQAEVRAEFSALKPHSILPRWLYLRRRSRQFHELTTQVVARISQNDPKFGTTPKPRKSRKKRV